MIATICPDRQTLLRYSLGTLPEEEREALDSHLDACPDCQAMIVTLDDADDTAIGRLRMPLSGEAVLAEPQLQDALAAALGMPAPMPEASDMPRMLGEYRLIAELGRGGMGRVYKALHTKLDRVVAIKVSPRPLGEGQGVRAGRAGDANAATRFAREMRAVGRLAHPNIVQAYDAREIDGTAVLIMELVDGLDLAEIVRRAGPLAVPDACELVRQTALALQCAHEHGLVHRDIKPSNIMLARSGEVKLLDLGLARFFAESGAEVSSASHLEEMTGTGQAMGTADYMAPEQASDSRTVDIRADIYSLGCTFYKLLTGRAPFSGPEYRTTLDKMNAHVHQSVPPVRKIVPEVPEPLAAVLDRMLAKDPAARFATPAEVAEAIAPFCAGADLPALLRQAEEGQAGQQGQQGEDKILPSPAGRGAEGEGGVVALQPAARPHRLKSLPLKLLALLLFGGLCFALGIVITIKKDGQTYRLQPPPNSDTKIDPSGNATVEIAGSHAPDSQPVAGPVPVIPNATVELESLRGEWKLARVQTGSAADHMWQLANTDFFRTGARFFFGESTMGPNQSNQTTLVVPHLHEGAGVASVFTVNVGSSAAPKWIDMYVPGSRELFALGIYEIDRDTLKLCLAKYSSPDARRPKGFEVRPTSDDVLLELERYQPTPDEMKVRGKNWELRTLVDNGQPIDLDSRRTPVDWYLHFSEHVCEVQRFLLAVNQGEGHALVADRTGTQFWQYLVDKSSPLGEITFYSEPPAKLGPLLGIYKLENDQLTIAYHKGAPRPQKFESAAGSGFTLMTLERGSRSGPGGGRGSRGRGGSAGEPGATPNSAAAMLPTVRVTQPVVCNVCDYEEYTGRIEKGEVEVMAPPGVWFLQNLGDTVKEGELLAVDSTEQEVRSALEAFFKTASEKGQRRYGIDAKVKADVDARLKSKRESLDQALRKHPTAKKILAPVSGKIVNEQNFERQATGPLQQVIEIDSTDSMVVAFDVPESVVLAHRRMPNRKPGWELSLPVVCGLADDKGFPYRGKVVSVADQIDPKTHTQRWQAVVPNKNGIFISGMSVRVRVITSEPHKVMLISPDVLCRVQSELTAGETNTMLYVVSGQNVIESRAVKLGRLYDGYATVIEGLKPDEQVIVERYGFPQNPGMTVKPAMITTPPPPWAAISVPPTVSVTCPSAREVTDYDIYAGRVDKPVLVPAIAPVTGTIENAHCKVGQTVKQGDLLAEMLADTEAAKLGPLEERLEKARAGLVGGSDGQAQVQRAQMGIELEAAEKALDGARAKLNRTQVLAPCRGTVNQEIPIFSGNGGYGAPARLLAGQQLASLTSLDSISASFGVDEQTVIRLRRSMADQKRGWELSLPVSCGLADDRSFPIRGKVSRVDNEILPNIEPRVSPFTRTQRWWLELPNKEGVLVPGMLLRVRLATSAAYKALLVPEKALGSEGKFVFVVNDQNVAERHDVYVGQLQDDGLRVVTKGLSGDDRVVLDPSKVTAGMTVKPEEPAAAQTPIH